MSGKKLWQEADRWYRQAVDDLDVAAVLLNSRKYAQSCFNAQQAAEKGLKAVCYLLDTDPWGHSCTKLIQNLPEVERNRFDEAIEAALSLDKLYIPTRYPDALAELIPTEAFTQKEAEAAISLSQEILTLVEARIYKGDNDF
ncbi:MAG: hypothetical protein HLUCCA11_14420 [Phormidesmis priestleyi Ana]|uniref:HEPN domain-containing protein n=1 Tax=Phormidesmis priestleyi Ana TaxID=1666911 RepID=A0A0N8KMR7_9CYAN|nr:MAG: hypothetical protein HLUCCA11_14420 [Phormidesmis priestleyi Ana]